MNANDTNFSLTAEAKARIATMITDVEAAGQQFIFETTSRSKKTDIQVLLKQMGLNILGGPEATAQEVGAAMYASEYLSGYLKEPTTFPLSDRAKAIALEIHSICFEPNRDKLAKAKPREYTI